MVEGKKTRNNKQKKLTSFKCNPTRVIQYSIFLFKQSGNVASLKSFLENILPSNILTEQVVSFFQGGGGSI